MKKTLKIILLSIVSIIALVVIYSLIRTSYTTDTSKKYIYADDGRKLVMHGMNILTSGKDHPLRIGSLTKEDVLRISNDWGFNAVRLLVYWDGIEPTKGKYDYEYLARVRERLDWCEEAGLKVILDMHQDLYAVRYGGDGAPEWAIIHEDEPFEMQSPWELNYLQPAVQKAIENFWDSSKGHGELKQHFLKSTLEVIKYVEDHPALLGIDLYNEPSQATWDGMMSLEEDFLMPYYKEAIARIREMNNDIWIFYEPSALGVNQGLKSKLSKLEDPRKGDSRLVYFPHIYTLDLDVTNKYMGNPFFVNLWANARQKEYKEFDTPMLIGEFGADENAKEYLYEVVQMCDKMTSGWFYWTYDKGHWSIIDDQRNEVSKAKVLERPYPKLIAGSNPDYVYNRDNRTFDFKIIWDKSSDEETTNNWTEIYLPNHVWPNGWNLKKIVGDVEWIYDEASRVLKIKPLEYGNIHIKISE